MKRIGIILSFLFLHISIFAQHNSDYIQYMFNGLLLNPAYAGSNEALDATLLYRKQWLGFEGAPTTISFGAHAALKNRRLNAGILIESEEVGLYKHTQALGIYAYRLKVEKGFLSMGLQVGVDNYTYNWSALEVKDENDPNFSSPGQRSSKLTAGAGVYYYNKNMYLGLSAPSLLQEKYGTVILTGGGLVPVSESFKIKPVFIIKYLPASTPVLNLSATCYFRQIVGLGAGLSLKNSAFIFADIAINEQMRFGYGYAYPLSRINMYTPGTHEVMLRYLFKYKIKAASPRYF